MKIKFVNTVMAGITQKAIEKFNRNICEKEKEEKNN